MEKEEIVLELTGVLNDRLQQVEQQSLLKSKEVDLVLSRRMEELEQLVARKADSPSEVYQAPDI